MRVWGWPIDPWPDGGNKIYPLKLMKVGRKDDKLKI